MDAVFVAVALGFFAVARLVVELFARMEERGYVLALRD
jgi:hypothetical protein